MEELPLKCLLIIGASAVVMHAARKGALRSRGWHARMIACVLACEPRMPVVATLANKISQIIWTLMTTGKNYRALAVTQ